MDWWPFRGRLCVPTVGEFPPGVKILCKLYNPQKSFGWDYKPWPRVYTHTKTSHTHVWDPVVYVRVRWIKETLSFGVWPEVIVVRVAGLCRSWLSLGKSTQIPHGRNPNRTMQLLCTVVCGQHSFNLQNYSDRLGEAYPAHPSTQAQLLITWFLHPRSYSCFECCSAPLRTPTVRFIPLYRGSSLNGKEEEEEEEEEEKEGEEDAGNWGQSTYRPKIRVDRDTSLFRIHCFSSQLCSLLSSCLCFSTFLDHFLKCYFVDLFTYFFLFTCLYIAGCVCVRVCSIDYLILEVIFKELHQKLTKTVMFLSYVTSVCLTLNGIAASSDRNIFRRSIHTN